MRNIILAVFALAISSITLADPVILYDGTRVYGHEQLNRSSYETCINRFKQALHPAKLGLNATYYSGKSVKTDQRVLYINGSYFRDGQRVRVGIACKTNYRGMSVTSLKASIGAQYMLREGATRPELFAGN